MAKKTEPKFVTVSEVAADLAVSRETVTGWIRAGRLRAIDISARKGRATYRVHVADLEIFTQARAVTADAPVGRRRKKTTDDDVTEYY